MLRGFVVSLLCLLALPSAAQYNVKKMMEEGRRTLDQGYYVTSMQIFSRIVALKPNLYEAWYLMALSKYHLEDYKGAGDDCRRALTLQPYIADIYELYGMSIKWAIARLPFSNLIISLSDGRPSMQPPNFVPTS